MPTVACPYCSQQIAGTTVRCPVCRNPLPVQLRAAANAQREAEKRQREAERQAREAGQTLKADEKARQAAERKAALDHAETRAADVDRMNEQIADTLDGLESLLASTLERDDFLDFDYLKDVLTPKDTRFDGGNLEIRNHLEPIYSKPALELPAAPADLSPPLLARILPSSKRKHAERVQEQARQHEEEMARCRATHAGSVTRAKESHEEAVAAYEKGEAERLEKLAAAKAKHASTVKQMRADVKKQNESIDEAHRKFDEGDTDAIVEYFTRVLTRSSYPPGFPSEVRVGFMPESRQLVVEKDLPTIDAIPTVKAYRYVKSRDEVTETARPASQIRSLYSQVACEIAIRTLHELFEADRTGKADTIALSCFVDTTDPGTGKAIHPCLVTVRTTKDAFGELDLAKVEPSACLKALSASVSRNSAELAPVRPLVDFNMVDPRFVEESDVLSALDQRPNLMELTPSEFESLITNLFSKMGLETRLTQASRDGGVDCVAWDERPILGGKVVIQAKRYKNTVGVSAVRDLFGTMQNEGASKGILVTTSGYGKASFTFAEGKPIELLSGGNLLYLLSEHAGIEAKIEPPEDWVDPGPEMDEAGEVI